MIFTELTKEEFTKFVDESPIKNFFQTVKMYNRLKKEKVEVYLVGVKDKGTVRAASMLAAKGVKFLGKKVFEAYKGFILDYEDKELVQFMTEEVSKFLKSKGGMKLIIDPYLVNVSRDMDANQVEGVDNRHIRSYLESLGYKYNENGEQVKWTYCLDIMGKSSEELLKEMKSNTRNCIHKTMSKFHLNVRDLKKEELRDFKKVTSDTCDRRSFADKSLEYYEDMYEAFGDEVVFKMCELNCDTFLSSLNQEQEELRLKLSKLSDAKANDKKKENIRTDLLNNEKKIASTLKLKEERGNVIPLAVAMFILYGDEVVYLFSGSYAELMSFFGQYAIQWDIIKYAAEQGYKRYNFYGIQDVFDPKGKDRGVYEFKKGFGGYVEELLGSFELKLNFFDCMYEFLRKVKRLIKR